VPIGDDCAILEIVLRRLARDGFGRVTIAIGHLGELIRAYAGTGGQWGLNIDYATETKPLNTMVRRLRFWIGCPMTSWYSTETS